MRIVSVALLACFVSQVHAQQFASPLSSIRVTGEAVVTAKPDRVLIDVGVLTQEKQSIADAERRQLTELKPALEAFARLLETLRRADFNERADRPAGVDRQ